MVECVGATQCAADALNLEFASGEAERSVAVYPDTTGLISAVQFASGDEVAQDEEIATIETDKIDVSVNAPQAGVLKELLAKEEETVTVGQEIAKMDGGASAGEGQKKETGSSEPKSPAPSDQQTSSQPSGKQESEAPKEQKETPKPQQPQQQQSQQQQQQQQPSQPKPQPPPQPKQPEQPKQQEKSKPQPLTKEGSQTTPGAREERKVC